MKANAPLIAVALFLLTSCAEPPSPASVAEFDHQHSTYAQILTQHVENGLVDYPAIKARPADLQKYLNELAAVDEPTFRAWTEPQRLAYLINLYNAQTIALIVDHYPLGSIRDIGFLPLAAWRKDIVHLFGKKTSLGSLENKIIRKQYQEPRIHFALVCAAKGCPNLINDPYLADRLDQQLDRQTRLFLNTREKNRVDFKIGTIFLSNIFKWYDEDFGATDRKVAEFVKPYFNSNTIPQEGGDLIGFRIRYTDYDWSLNDGSTPFSWPLKRSP